MIVPFLKHLRRPAAGRKAIRHLHEALPDRFEGTATGEDLGDEERVL